MLFVSRKFWRQGALFANMDQGRPVVDRRSSATGPAVGRRAPDTDRTRPLGRQG
jgi:hypothetical protein